MSVRPDVLPQETLDELTILQDSVEPFDTEIAVRQIEEELGGPLGQFFTSISEEPVAAASLAQVYLATLNDGKDTRVAVKVQRSQVLSDISAAGIRGITVPRVVEALCTRRVLVMEWMD